MPIPNLNRTIKNLQRLQQIVNVFVKHGFGHLIEHLELGRYAPRRRYQWWRRQESIPPSAPERLRLAFEELGATFIKLGQLLSTRPDLVPPEYLEELRKLQHAVPPFPLADIERILQEELHQPRSEIFSEFSETPLAAASIAQVHRACLVTGDAVVVKVQRPGIDRLIETDLHILMAVARLLEKRVAELRHYDPVALVHEFSKSVRRELDFTMEGANTDTFFQHYGEDPNVKIPQVFWDFSSRRVLVLEEIQGIPIDQIEQIEALGLDRKTLAANCLDLFFIQIFEQGCFHADPHPGNLMVLADGCIALIDFGLVGRLNREMLNYLSSWFVAILTQDVEEMVKIYMRMGILRDDANITSLKMDMTDFLDRYFSLPLERIQLGELMEEAFTNALQYQIQLPPPFLLLGKCIITIEGIVLRLDPQFSMVESGKPYVQRIWAHQMDPRSWLRDLAVTLSDVQNMMRDLPVQLNQILHKLQRGNLKVDVESYGLEHLSRELDRVSHRLSFSLIIAALIVGSSTLVMQGTGPKLFGYGALGIVGYLIAGILGLGLVVSILRSGKL